ncbi:MAG: HAD-IB family phosphatase [Chloroflexota bacterium]|nr:HAD-IB family phosphatase [Chloroflexota bacterium]
MTRAELVPQFPADAAPVSFLVDYDGTISQFDVGDALMARFVEDRSLVAEKDLAYYEGRVGSRELMLWDLSVLPGDAEALREAANSLAQDATFEAFVRACRRWRAAVEVVSDGFGFHVEPNLARLGLGDLPVATNETRLDGPDRGMSFPFGHPRCFVCGTCKRERVRVHQAARRAVVFIGDGTSDRYAAAYADVVFAKGELAQLCVAEGWSYRPWRSFADVTGWLETAFRAGKLPRAEGEFAGWRGQFGAAPRPFICGPEVWGPDRTMPGPGPG